MFLYLPYKATYLIVAALIFQLVPSLCSFLFKKNSLYFFIHFIVSCCTSIILLLQVWPVMFNNTNIELYYLYFCIVMSILWVLALIYGYFFFNAEEWRRFAVIGNIIVVCGVVCIFLDNVLLEFFFYEIITVLTIPLILYPISQKSLSALKIYVMYFAIASFFLFPSIIGLMLLNSSSAEILVELCMVGIFFFTIKSAVFPLHGWLVKAMVAPVPVSSLFHAVVVVKVGILFLIKNLDRLPYFPVSMREPILAIVCFSIIFFSIKNLFCTNIKEMLAYSTIIQLHYMLCFLLNGLFFNSIEYAISHSFSKIVLFMSYGCIYLKTGHLEKKEMNGYGKFLKMPCFLYIMASLSLIGFPLYNGFFQKVYALDHLFNINDSVFLVFTFLISNVCTAFYLLDFVFRAFFYPCADEDAKRESLKSCSCFLYFSPIAALFFLSFCWFLRY